MPEINDVIDELTYRSYRFNRDSSPDVTPEKWGLVFGNVPEMEARYQREKIDRQNNYTLRRRHGNPATNDPRTMEDER